MKLTVKQDILDEIHRLAEKILDRMYDPRFPEDSQCSGYHAFKQIVIIQEPLPTVQFFKEEELNENLYALFRKIHPKARYMALRCARRIRERYKIYKDEPESGFKD